MAWQSGWTAIGYDAKVVRDPGDSVALLFDEKYKGHVGMMSDPWELGSIGLLRNGIWPALSTEADWRKAATALRAQRDDGIVRGYYGQNYIDVLTSGKTGVPGLLRRHLPGERERSPAPAGTDATRGRDVLDRQHVHPGARPEPQGRHDGHGLLLRAAGPGGGGVHDDYVRPVPSAQRVLLNPTGWAETALTQMKPEIGLPPTTANAPTVFPTAAYIKNSRNYYQYKNQEELTAWNNLFLPITQGS